jgi:N-methylhydantoinase A
MEISTELARKAIKEKIAEPLDLTVEDAAFGIYQITREKMVGGILNMTVRRGIDPREFIIVSGGGATGLFVADLAKEIKVKRVIIPRETATLCAFGALNADISMSSVAIKYSDSDEFNYEQVNRTLGELEVKGKAFLNRLGAQSENWKFDFYSSARYPMQVTELEVRLRNKQINRENLPKLVDDFHEAHLTRYKTADLDSPVEFVMWRSVARNRIPGIELPKEYNKTKNHNRAFIGKLKAFFESEKKFVEIPYYNGEKSIPGMKVEGPAIIVFPDTTILVPHRFTIEAQENGYYIMEIPY